MPSNANALWRRSHQPSHLCGHSPCLRRPFAISRPAKCGHLRVRQRGPSTEVLEGWRIFEEAQIGSLEGHSGHREGPGEVDGDSAVAASRRGPSGSSAKQQHLRPTLQRQQGDGRNADRRGFTKDSRKQLYLIKKPGGKVIFADYPWIMKQWEPLGKRLRSDRPVSREDAASFGRKLLGLLHKYEEWSNSALATALHRLGVLRDECEEVPAECSEAFFQLLRHLRPAVPRMRTQEVSMTVWATGKFCQLEGYRLPHPGPSAAIDSDSGGPSSGAPSLQAVHSPDGDDVGSSISNSEAGPELREAEGSELELAEQTPSNSSPHPRETAFMAPAQAGASSSRLDAESAAEQVGQEAIELSPPPIDTGAAPQRTRRPLRLRVQRSLPAGIQDDLDQLALRFIAEMHNATSQGMCNLLWGCARIGYSPLNGRLFWEVQRRVAPAILKMNRQDVSNLWFAYGALQEPLQARLAENLSRRTLNMVKSKALPYISVPIILKACVRLGENTLDGDFFDELIFYLYGESEQPLKRLTAEALTNLLVAVTTVRSPRTLDFVEVWASQCVRRVLEFSTEQVEAIIETCAELGVDPLDGRLLQTLRREHFGYLRQISKRETAHGEESPSSLLTRH